jgi:RHH-type transcriptional regulator, proline utilization regulon repressor / proline dehydrogenase / delta 1-pyrroline-5-carboxylate dehydrogenase
LAKARRKDANVVPPAPAAEGPEEAAPSAASSTGSRTNKPPAQVGSATASGAKQPTTALAAASMSTATSAVVPITDAALEAIEKETQQLGRTLWDLWQRRQPTLFERRWWDDRLLGVAMADESVKVQMFRFVDVLPRLRSHQDVTRHLQEYFDEVRHHLPWAVELVRFGIDQVRPNSVLSRALAYNARRNAVRMAERFLAGSTPEDILTSITALRQQGLAFTLDWLGEAVLSEAEAEAYSQQYLQLLRELAPVVNAWPEHLQTDRDAHGPIPRMNVSVKLSALVSRFRPHDPLGTATLVKERLRPLLRTAREVGAYVHVDMEQAAYKDLTLAIFQQVLMEAEFRDFADVGIVLQAYLRDSEADALRLRQWVAERGTPVWVRLVKGAYWDYETVTAYSHGWPVPVYEQKWQSDESFEKLSVFLLQEHRWLRPAFGSHNLRSLSHVMSCAQQMGLPQSAYELQMLYGMASDLADVLVQRGERVRIYTPFGSLIPGMAYLVRRLLENTSNDSFLRHSVSADLPVEDLLMKPSEVAKRLPPKPVPAPPAFLNEPLSDFTREAHREAMERALERVSDQLGEDYGLMIGGKTILNRPLLQSINPSRHSQVVGRVAMATPDDAVAAIDTARRAFASWSKTEVQYRAEYLDLIARELRQRRFEFAAWQVFEVGKTWVEADADVAEAIDFCVYYAQQMRRLDAPQIIDVPGEENRYFYRARGVTVVIAPWNFPLAILAGMTTAALVTGNTVIMKPAEQASVVAAKFAELLHDVGIPDGVISFLPGVGEEIGPQLVGSPDVDVIAFTGSRAVGLAIQEQAVQPQATRHGIKKVIVELGGKNAIIVDSDADLDEAVAGVLHSAFGYAGQKCSACSRVIVLEDGYDEFIRRLVEAAKALTVGPADWAGADVGPVIDSEAYERLNDVLANLEPECEVLLAGDAGPKPSEGYFIGPHILSRVAPYSRIAREELFGPILCVFSAKDLTEALALANDTDYALTGGCYSRSPANLKRVYREMAVGNLYLNRPITGALVARQPFGGYKLSGTGTKAGGPDYLFQFLLPISVTENTLRRGFAPSTEAPATSDG